MEKRFAFDGVEINGSLNEVVSKLEANGYCIDTPPFGDRIMIATLRGEYADYCGLCQVMVSTNPNGVVDSFIVDGEGHYSVKNVLEDFDFFRKNVLEYEKQGFELYDEEDNFFDEDDIESIRDGSIEKSVFFKRDSDKSSIIVSVKANDDDDLLYVQLALFNGANKGDTKESMRVLKEDQEQLHEKLAQAKSSHLVFNGIEMDGPIEDFVDYLEKKGFRVDKEPQWLGEQEIAQMHGPFMGEPCKLTISSNSCGDITLVYVEKKERKSFDIVKDEFYKLLRMYTKKYGEPDEIDESLIKMSDQITVLKNEKGSLNAFFKVGSEGSSISIIVTIEEDSHYPHIIISYADGINQGFGIEDNVDTAVDNIDMDNYYDDI